MPRAPHLVLTGMAVALFAATGWSAPHSRGNDASGISRIWAFATGNDSVEVRVERSRGEVKDQETLVVRPGESVEVRRSGDETVSVPGQRDLLLVTASMGFDPAAIRLGTRSRSRADGAAKAAAGTAVKTGEVISSPVLWVGMAPRTLSLDLRGPKSWAEVRLKKPDGEILGYVTFGASRDVSVTVDFGRLLDAKGYWGVVSREILVRQGELTAFTGTAPVSRGHEPGRGQLTTKAIAGNGHFNYNINWQQTPPLTYEVTSGPASTCGELDVERNGVWQFTSGWLCTDATGYAFKGPWYWANQTGDETSQGYIRWPNNDTTTTDWHIWDTQCPSINVDQSCQGRSPSCWQGFASDPPYGACFNSAWAYTYSSFAHVDAVTGAPLDWWSPSTGTYGNSYTQVYGSLVGMPTCGASWSSSFPSAGSHTSGQVYRWDACVYDGSCTACFQHDFIAP